MSPWTTHSSRVVSTLALFFGYPRLVCWSRDCHLDWGFLWFSSVCVRVPEVIILTAAFHTLSSLLFTDHSVLCCCIILTIESIVQLTNDNIKCPDYSLYAVFVISLSLAYVFSCFALTVVMVILIMLGEEYLTNRHMKPTFTSQLSFFVLREMLTTLKVVSEGPKSSFIECFYIVTWYVICNLMLFRKLWFIFTVTETLGPLFKRTCHNTYNPS
jgi:hypothetical protein